MEIFHYNKGFWFIEDSLPLHMCHHGLSPSIYLFPNRRAFELMLFIGSGGIHSLLTPELTHGTTLLDKIDYFLAMVG